MADSGYVTPTQNIIVRGTSPLLHRRNIGSATNMYPGRIVVREATDYDIKVGDGILPPLGWLGYEDFNETERPATIDTIATVDTEGPVHSGGGFAIRGTLHAGTKADQGDLLASWSDGLVIPAILIGGVPAIKIPFSKNATLKDTGIDIPAGAWVGLPQVYVTTHHDSGTIDIGLGAGTEAGHDADGLVDGLSLNTEDGKWATHDLVHTTEGSITAGVLLDEAHLKDAGNTYAPVLTNNFGHICDGTCVSLDYTTSDHDVAGYFYVPVMSPGVQIVGKAGAAADASAAAVNIFVESVL